jgi:hypothetical protein
MRTWLLHALWIALLAALCPAVEAQPASPAYEEALAEAIRAHQARDWPRAKQQFEQAHALYPNARALRGIGVAAFEDGQYLSAIRALEAALEHPERRLPDDLRELTQLLIAQARARVGQVRVERSPADARVFVDGAAAVFEPDGGLLLDPGVHELRVEAPGYASTTRSIELASGATVTLIVDLSSQSAAVALPVVADAPGPLLDVSQPRATEDRGPKPGRSRLRRAAAWSTTALTGAAVISAGMLWFTGRQRLRELDEHCDSKPRGCSESEARRRLADVQVRRLERGVKASVGVAGGMLIGASLLWGFEFKGLH